MKALLEMESVDLAGRDSADVAATSVVDVAKAFEKVQLCALRHVVLVSTESVQSSLSLLRE